jgi:hypothetical protein
MQQTIFRDVSGRSRALGNAALEGTGASKSGNSDSHSEDSATQNLLIGSCCFAVNRRNGGKANLARHVLISLVQLRHSPEEQEKIRGARPDLGLWRIKF